MKKTLKIIGLVAGSIITVLLLFLFVFPLFFVTPENIEVSISVPENLSSQDSFEVVYTIENLDSKERVLDSVDVEELFFEEVQLVSISEKTADQYSVFGFNTFEFQKVIQPQESLDIIFTLRAMEGIHYSETDICIDSAASCISKNISLFVGDN